MILLAALSLALAPAQTLEGRWQGTLDAGAAKLRLVLDISKKGETFHGTLTSVDQGGTIIPIDKIQVTGDQVRLEIDAVKGTYEGTLNAGATRIKGTWTQAVGLPLEFERAPAGAKPEARTHTRAGTAFGLPFDVRVPQPPMPVPAAGKLHLVYELHITNFSPMEFGFEKLEVLAGSSVLASFEAEQLNAILARPGQPAAERDAIGPGQRSVAYLFLSLSGAPPATLKHRITAGGATLEAGVVDVSTAKPVQLGPPLRGDKWIAGNGPANHSAHRRALMAFHGKATIAQRFAIDFVRMAEGKKTYRGDDSKNNKSYAAWGAEALAVSDAAVVSIKDGIPENEPGPASRAVPITQETIGGNYVVLDLGGGRFAFYAHLQPGSLRVKPGDKVKRGQVLGLVGNSGNSTEPHLHFQVTNGPEPLASEGLPFVLGDGEIPLQNAEVKFP